MHHCFLCVEKLRRKVGCLRLEVKACLALCADLPAVDVVYHTNCLGLEVKACLALCADLPAVDVVYHTNCHREFLNGRQ